MALHWNLAALAALSLLALTPSAPASAAKAVPDCFTALRHPNGERLACTHEAWMTDDERAEVKKLTRGYLLDARCTVAVNVDRKLVDEAMAASDRVWDAPPQPVTCALHTSRGPMTIAGTFAPHVVFKEGFAVDASPGLANITGVNTYLAWPVVAYVNSARAIKSEMATMINAFRSQVNRRQQASNINQRKG